MNILLLPDFLAMALLVGVLLMVRGRETHANIRLWTAGLLLILLERAAGILYTVPADPLLHRAMHAVGLDAYLLAGVMFLRSGSNVLRRMPRSRTFLWVNVMPHLLLLVAYAMDVQAAWVYRGLVALGVTAAITTCVWTKRGLAFYVAFALVWTPMALAASHDGYRSAIYITLAMVYGTAGVLFARSLPQGSRGKIAVVAGFAGWALCFATHPVITARYGRWEPFVNEVWTMQKFIVTVGLLLVMLERQVRSNEWLALHDELTKLPNRRLFDDRLQQALARAERMHLRVGLFMLDLDGFKEVNDTLGHDAGDALLEFVAENLNAAVRKTDTLARLGGDEFSLIAFDLGTGPDKDLPPNLLPQAQRIFNSLVQAVEKPLELGEGEGRRTVQVGASVGLAVYPDEGTDVQTLTRLADARMYQQKSARKSGVRRPVQPTLWTSEAS